MKTRTYYYFSIPSKDAKEKILDLGDDETIAYKEVEIECLDRFKDELGLFAFPIQYMHKANKLFEIANLKGDLDYFFKECKEVISVPEKHQDSKGNEGKLNFQAYFHDIPYSIESINDRAIVVVALDVLRSQEDSKGFAPYKLAGYLHANEFNFTKGINGKERYTAYYYNMLRISEAMRNGQKIYRRTGVFSTMFSLMLNLSVQKGMHFSYATMGKANESMNKVLKKLVEYYGKKWDILSMTSNSHLTFLYGRSWYRKNLIDITTNENRIKELYEKSNEIRGNQMFNQYPTYKDFRHQYDRIITYSKSTKAYMYADKSGKMLAACIAVNWGDYFSFLLDNPKGVFKLLANLKLTDKLLYMWLTVGDATWAEKLYRGIAKKYQKEQGVKMGIYNTYEGDPFKKIKNSIINDPFNYFVIYDDLEMYEELKQLSKDKEGNVQIFIDTPML